MSGVIYRSYYKYNAAHMAWHYMLSKYFHDHILSILAAKTGSSL